MFYFICVWTFLTAICWLIGNAIINSLNANCFERIYDRFIIAVWLGIVVLSIALLTVSLAFPLSTLVGLAIAILVVTLSLFSERSKAEINALCSVVSTDLIIVFISLEIVVAALTTKQVTWIDTGLYHFGSIQWLSEFGAVPGVALIHSRLGFTSSWFALAAPLNPEVLSSRASAITNGFIFFVSILHFLISIAHTFRENAKLYDWLVIIWSLIVIPLCTFLKLLSKILVSPSPDLPVILLIGVTAWTILIISNQEQPLLSLVKTPAIDAQIIPLILAAGALTMKPTALPLLAVAILFYFFDKKFSIQRVLCASAIIVLLLSPMIIFGTITSGCPLYPSTFMCFDLPWTINAPTAVKELAQIRGWGHWFGEQPPGTNYYFWFLWNWLKYSRTNQLMTLLIICSLIGTVPILKKLKHYQIRQHFWLLAIGVIGVIFIMIQAPQFRLGVGYFILIPSYLLANYCHRSLACTLSFSKPLYLFKSLASRFPWLIRLFPLFLASLLTVSIIDIKAEFSVLLPPKLPTAQVIPKQINDVQYVSPIEGSALCWAAELPCTFITGLNIQLRKPSQGIGAGFIHAK